MKTVLMTGAACLGMAGLIVACAPQPKVADGRRDFLALCADCHGATGRGDGPAASASTTPPADLTQISARNGGKFPQAKVMARIDGYIMGQGDSPMPAFGDLLDGETIPYDIGDGLLTPTPVRLVALAEYLQTIQE